jgi:4a-hydroxytetrahydrobiopterin dehydratase
MDSEVVKKKCAACEGEVAKLSDEMAGDLLKQVRGWEMKDEVLRREFRFKNYHEVMAFVNAVAWVSHREDHHPDMEVGYNRVVVSYVTHAVGGLTENDFICAAKVGALLDG